MPATHQGVPAENQGQIRETSRRSRDALFHDQLRRSVEVDALRGEAVDRGKGGVTADLRLSGTIAIGTPP